jgi:Ca-activated chloride channel family protein
VSTSTYGLGYHFNEDLMVAMARSGQGNHYYGETAQDLFEPFAEEFDLIANLHARQLRLSLGTPAEVKATLLNDYPLEARDGFTVARLPDLAWGAEAWALVELQVPAPAEGGDPAILLQVEVTATDLDGNPVAFPEAQLRLPVLPAQAWEALLPDPLVLQRLNELEASRMLDAARAAARQGDWAAIDRILAEARARFADNPWLQQVLETLVGIARQRNVEAMAKEAMYSSSRMHSRLTPKEDMLSMDSEADMASYLRRKTAQGRAQYRKGPEDDQQGGKA